MASQPLVVLLVLLAAAAPAEPHSLEARASSSSSKLLRTRASFFIEPEALLSRASPLHDQLWEGVYRVHAPATMYSPWAPYPHYAVGALTPPSNNGTAPCTTSWNMTLMEQMVDDYVNATSFDTDHSPYFLFSQSPCWLWVDGDCTIPPGPNELAPSHKSYSGGTIPRVAGYREIGDYFGRLAAYFRSGGFMDECGKFHSSAHRVPLQIKWWGVTNEAEHVHRASPIDANIAMYDAIVAGIQRFEKGTESPMKYVGVNQNVGTGAAGAKGATAWLSAFLNRARHANSTVPIGMVGLHGYFRGPGNFNGASAAFGGAAESRRHSPVCDPWGSGTNGTAAFESLFPDVEAFMRTTVAAAIKVRDTLAPEVQLTLGEWGVEPKGDVDSSCHQIIAEMPRFQLASAGVMSFGWGLMAERGIDLVLQSQYTGHSAGTPFLGSKQTLPRNYYPGLALYNYSTAELQPRSVVNQVIVARFDVGRDRVLLPPTSTNGSSSSNASVYSLTLETPSGTRKLLLVNKKNTAAQVSVDAALKGRKATAWFVDESYATEPSPRVELAVHGYRNATFAPF